MLGRTGIPQNPSFAAPARSPSATESMVSLRLVVSAVVLTGSLVSAAMKARAAPFVTTLQCGMGAGSSAANGPGSLPGRRNRR